MTMTRDQKLFISGVRAGLAELTPMAIDLDDRDMWSAVRQHFPTLAEDGNGESPAAPAIRDLAAKAAAALTSNTEQPKHTRKRQ